jgi:hypothetical protein
MINRTVTTIIVINATPEELTELEPYLVKTRTIAYTFWYGKEVDMPDYSKIKSTQVMTPRYLCEDEEEALILAAAISHKLNQTKRHWLGSNSKH